MSVSVSVSASCPYYRNPMLHSPLNGLMPAGHCSRLMIPANDWQLKYDRPVVLWAKRYVR